MIRPKHLVSSVMVTLCSAAADPIADFDALKARNARVLTECIDFKAQTGAQRADSRRIELSLKSYLATEIKDADRLRYINGYIAGVASDNARTVVIFYIDSIGARPGQALRTDHRERLEELLTHWRVDVFREKRRFVVRFADECDVPVADWK